jgi:hypothetical protein
MKAFWALSYQLAKGKNALIFHQAIGIARLKFNVMGKALRVEGKSHHRSRPRPAGCFILDPGDDGLQIFARGGS